MANAYTQSSVLLACNVWQYVLPSGEYICDAQISPNFVVFLL